MIDDHGPYHEAASTPAPVAHGRQITAELNPHVAMEGSRAADARHDQAACRTYLDTLKHLGLF